MLVHVYSPSMQGNMENLNPSWAVRDLVLNKQTPQAETQISVALLGPFSSSGLPGGDSPSQLPEEFCTYTELWGLGWKEMLA